jgi:hypothetical protein
VRKSTGRSRGFYVKSTIWVILALCFAVRSEAAARYVVAGGGFYPEHSEVVLEKNVELFRETALGFGIDLKKAVATVFASGTNPTLLDISELNPQTTASELLFAQLFREPGRPDLTLRHNRLTDLLGASNAPNVKKLLAAGASGANASTPFRFYYTGHGAYERSSSSFFLSLSEKSPDQKLCAVPDTQWAPTASGNEIPVGQVPAATMARYRNNYLALWDDTKLHAPDFTAALDAFPSDTPVQVVMVQCFSGGFAQMNYEGGKVTAPLSKANRCGFFATIPSRVAAGCSADINKREEYSPYFIAALRGRTENGQKVDADYDKDGRVTSDEAHAYVVLHEGAIDVPITTSSHLLRERSEFLPTDGTRVSWSWIESRLTPTERAVVEGLAKELGADLASQASPIAAVRAQISAGFGVLNNVNQQASAAGQRFGMALNQIASAIYKDHPVLATKYAPTGKPIEDARKAFVSHPGHDTVLKLYAEQTAAYETAATIQHRLAKWERLGYALETKVLEHDLEQAGSSEEKAKYQQLKACEHEPFFL